METTRAAVCVFVPGIKGSSLWCDTCGRRAWPPRFIDNPLVTAARLYKSGRARVEHMMNERELECLVEHRLRPVDVVRGVRVFGVRRDVYGEFLKRLAARLRTIGVETEHFPYVWCGGSGVADAARSLYRKLAADASRGGAIVLVGHSMGGLVCRYMVENVYNDESMPAAERKSLADRTRIVFALGTPHYGCVKALHSLVDPNGGRLTEFCRRTACLYEMIPFSDLDAQIERRVAAVARRRLRSDVFLKADGARVTVDPAFWNIGGARGDRDDHRSEAAGRTVATLLARFPALRPHRDGLARGVAFHMSLDNAKKPPDCVYVMLNAMGVVTPSSIDEFDRLQRRCTNGDGTVCSVVGGGAREPVASYNVHTRMLASIDVFTPIRDILAYGRAPSFTGRRRGPVSHFRSRTRHFSADTYNLTDGLCVIDFAAAADDDDERSFRDVAYARLVVVPVPYAASAVRKVVEIRTAHFGKTWKGARFVFTGHYSPVAFTEQLHHERWASPSFAISSRS